MHEKIVAVWFCIGITVFLFPFSLGVLFKLWEKFDFSNKWRVVSSIVTTLIIAVFVSWPISSRLAESNEQDIRRREAAQKNTIVECVDEFLREHYIYLSKEKEEKIADDIFKNKRFTDDEELGFWVDERYLKSLLIALE